MSKVALCLFGVIGSTDGKAGKSDPSLKVLKMGKQYYKENIFKYNDVDVFIHCWNKNYKQEILNHYKPKNYIIESQITFKVPDYVRGPSDRKQNHYSRWYSTKKSIELASEGKYDFILSSRFDIAWSKPTNFELYDKDKFYVGRWSSLIKGGKDIFEGGKGIAYSKPKIAKEARHKLKGYPHDNTHGLLDLWFFSNQKNMLEFAKLYDNLDLYNKKGNCPVDRNNTGNISSHQLALYHLSKIGLKDKIKESDHYLYDDFPLIRRKYFKCKY